jgi:AcrR family transcriptional regulator
MTTLRDLDTGKIASAPALCQRDLVSGKIIVNRTPYHHGALRAALLEAAEAILNREGPEGLTLREAARAAGVSHAAPTHHFGDLTGLLSELAAVGYRRFTDHLTAAAAASGVDPGQRLIALGKAYVRFARDYPNLFLLMFRGARLDRSRPALREAADAAFAVLRGTVGETRPDGEAAFAAAIRSWSLVHGFAMLLIDGQLPSDRSPDALLDAVLADEVHWSMTGSD